MSDDNVLKIKMLGPMEFEFSGKKIADSDTRSKKIWTLLAFLLYNKDRRISQDKLINVLWGDTDAGDSPTNALKTLFHRSRNMLDKLDDGLGKSLLICKHGEFYVNPDASFQCDLDEFDKLVNEAENESDDEERFQLLFDAFTMYKGDVLMHLSSENWVIPISTYYHNRFLDVTRSLLELCEAHDLSADAIEICLRAIPFDHYQDFLYVYLIRNLVKSERYQEAINVYTELSDMLRNTFGVKPDNDVRELYLEAVSCTEQNYIGVDEIQNQLTNGLNESKGALFCDYSVFCEFYHALSRSIERSGSVVHLAIISITDISDKPLARRSLTVVVNNLQELITHSLRQGDMAAMCSPSQFVIMLPNANRENAEMVVERIKKSFYRQYPHTPSKLNHVIQPVLPNNPLAKG